MRAAHGTDILILRALVLQTELIDRGSPRPSTPSQTVLQHQQHQQQREPWYGRDESPRLADGLAARSEVKDGCEPTSSRKHRAPSPPTLQGTGPHHRTNQSSAEPGVAPRSPLNQRPACSSTTAAARLQPSQLGKDGMSITLGFFLGRDTTDLEERARWRDWISHLCHCSQQFLDLAEGNCMFPRRRGNSALVEGFAAT